MYYFNILIYFNSVLMYDSTYSDCLSRKLVQLDRVQLWHQCLKLFLWIDYLKNSINLSLLFYYYIRNQEYLRGTLSSGVLIINAAWSKIKWHHIFRIESIWYFQIPDRNIWYYTWLTLFDSISMSDCPAEFILWTLTLFSLFLRLIVFSGCSLSICPAIPQTWAPIPWPIQIVLLESCVIAPWDFFN